MKPASIIMEKKINSIKFQNPIIKIVNNVTAKPETDSEMIKKLLVEQIFSSVRWRESLINMSKSNINNFVEIGPGKALAGMVKRTIKGANTFSINSIADIKNLLNEFKR